MEQLLKNFNDLLDEYRGHREYITRARAQASRFSSAVIEKVVLDHEIKSSAIADQILPLVPEIEQKIASIETDKSSIVDGKSSSDETLQELELRHLIGEMSDAEFDEATSELRATVDQANGRLDSLDDELKSYSEALESWVILADEAGQSDGISHTGDSEDVILDEPEPPEPMVPLVSDVSNYSNEAAVSRPSGVHAGYGGREDLSSVLPTSDDVEIDMGDDLSDDLGGDFGGDLSGDLGGDIGGGFTGDLDGGLDGGLDNGLGNGLDVDFEEEPALASIEMDDEDDIDDGVDLSLGSAAMVSISGGPSDLDLDPLEADDNIDDDDQISIDMGDLGEIGDDGLDLNGIGDIIEEPAATNDEPRRALLLYQEGTAEEQIYPFTGDMLTVGRGRDNDIQIKNDSKVSRFHCKLFRRTANFYIEDNKSSNGTLVNGELITERRLFGGEEIVIGETFFRFRIM
ncbi:MAG: FHA domain-containing protein [Myxococcota bacterium]